MNAPRLRFVRAAAAAAVVVALALPGCGPSSPPPSPGSEPVSFTSAGGVELEGRLFEAEGATAGVVLAHMRPADQSSWFDYADTLADDGYRTLTFNFRGYGKSDTGSRSELKQDVLGAIAFAKVRGYTRIALVGGSMGGAAVLDALDAIDAADGVDRVVLLAPAGGAPVKQAEIDKLFIVADGDSLRDRVKAIHAASADPKELVVFPGSGGVKHLIEKAEPRLGGDSVASVLRAAGAQIRDSWCGPCFGQGPDALAPGQRAITSFNRNWQNRMGVGGEGFLASPAVVAASALAGYMAPPSELGLTWRADEFGV